jgi:hypothetical protein
VFPTIGDAKAAVEKAQILDNVEQQVMGGDITQILTAVKNGNEEGFLKIADNYDDEVDNAVAAMTSLLEPIMIVFLAVIVGSIVIAMFLPLIDLMNRVGESGGGKKDE